ncbi:Proline-rich nuclear receptor coactivator [Quillaja saponaria]|uniref:Proline-rich nuclear receptor coactivator n=1 Tax=Quillaja saponaria TaxID=32244 RepID=A0AAD7LHD8_QUISA|nr:Proline-rich nuclear receptor coactivator [Quillaja saponaria]
MEAVLTPYTQEQSISACDKKIKMKNPKRQTRDFISKSSENFAIRDIHGGLLHPPPSHTLYFSYPSSASIFNHQYHQPNQQQPPLLPLPIPIAHQSLLSRSRPMSCPPTTPKNRVRDQKKPKPTKRAEEVKRDMKSATGSISEFLVVGSNNRLGPDPNVLPKDISLVLSSSPTASIVMEFDKISNENSETFSGLVFKLSPPPSSLPLPKFSLRPKLSCNADSAGIDAGATDNLRRLLKLR